jgi:hypothetical protein
MYSFIRFTAVATLVASLVACGGGGGGTPAATINQSITGTANGQAAVGAPMSYASISINSLVDQTSAKQTADEQGNFNIPTNVTYPALVRASSADSVYSYAGYIKSSAQTNVAVNPLSTLVLAIESAGNINGITAPITDADLSAAQNKVSKLFENILNLAGVSSTTDYLSTIFSTNHTALDIVLDAISIEFGSDGIIYLTNKINNTSISFTSSSISNIPPLPFSAQTFAKLGNIPLDSCSKFITSLNSDNLSKDASLFDPSFLQSGRNKEQFMSYISTLSSVNSFSYKMPIFKRIDGNGNYVFSAMTVKTGSNNLFSNTLLYVNTSGGNCMLTGDKFPIPILVRPAIKYTEKVDGNTDYVTASPFYGYEISLGTVNIPNLYGGQSISSARVEYCSSSNNCTVLAKLIAPSQGAWPYGNIINDGVTRHNSLSMIENPVTPFSSDLDNPVKVTFFSTAPAPDTGNAGQVGNPIFTNAGGIPFTASEVAAIKMPKITNPTIIQNSTPNPKIEYDAGSSTIYSITLSTANRSSSLIPNMQQLVLSDGIGSTTFTGFDLDATAYDRLILVNANLPNRSGTSISLRYIWAPTCSACR